MALTESGETQGRSGAKVSLVVYVAGYGRSGSTLLDTILGNHPRMFGAGEVTHLFREMRMNTLCSCGEKVCSCPLWVPVAERLGIQAADEAELRRLEEVTRSAERGGTGSSEYGKLWRNVYEAVAAESGRDIIVDSSKTAAGARWRPATLAKDAGFPVKVLHLVRDPRAVMWSVNRGSNRKLESGRPAKLAGGMLRGLRGWVVANKWAEELKTRLPASDFTLVRYEDIVTNPVGEVRRIGEFLGIDVAELVSQIEEVRPFDSGHGVSGNRMRRQGVLRFKLDEEWKTALPGYARTMSKMIWPKAERYGYRWSGDEARSGR